MNEPLSISVHELTKRFGDFTAVDRVSFEVRRGEIFGYLGANGAGKSTTIRMLCGLLSPSSGAARVADTDIFQKPEEVKRHIGYMSQKFSLYMDLRVEENLEFFGGAFGMWGKKLKKRAEYLLDRVELLDHAQMLTGRMPGGWRQRLALACAMLHEPEILFLDEPTSGVDPRSRRNFWRLIRELADEGTTVFVTTHYMDEAEYCDRVGLMVAGRLPALDTPSELKKTWVPGRMFMVRGIDSTRALSLKRRDEILAVESFGTGYHVQTSDEVSSPGDMGKMLQMDKREQVEIEEVEASLEDVFLRVIASFHKDNTSQEDS